MTPFSAGVWRGHKLITAESLIGMLKFGSVFTVGNSYAQVYYCMKTLDLFLC